MRDASKVEMEIPTASERRKVCIFEGIEQVPIHFEYVANASFLACRRECGFFVAFEGNVVANDSPPLGHGRKGTSSAARVF